MSDRASLSLSTRSIENESTWLFPEVVGL